MNNSLPKLIDGMIEALRQEIIPHLDPEFARGQAFGLIYLLKSIKLRASWSTAYLGTQLEALAETSLALKALSPDPALTALLPDVALPPNLVGAPELERWRDQGDAAICATIDWYFAHRASLEPETRDAIGKILNGYMTRQIDWEFANNTRPMLAEMSRGSEEDV